MAKTSKTSSIKATSGPLANGLPKAGKPLREACLRQPAATPHAKLLLAWYDRHRRVLPWRALPGEQADPYAVWLSEIMLQQTTVTAVKPYFEKFLSLWPDAAALARAPVDDIMKAWAGLGYYSRARNLHACAKMVAQDFGGVFPADEAQLRTLPGIGPYTAAAIAAIAFGQRAVVVDGNIERVVTRLFRIETPLPRAKVEIRAATHAITPDMRAGDFAQAMMDLGAGACAPKKPACMLCPLADTCAAHKAGDAASFPRRVPKAARPQRFGAVFYLRRADGHVLLRTRPPRGLLGGMSEFPGSEWQVGNWPVDAISAAPLKTRWKKLNLQVEHVFTHFALRLDVYAGEANAGVTAPDGMRFVHEDGLADEALPSLMRKVIAVVTGASTN